MEAKSPVDTWTTRGIQSSHIPSVFESLRRYAEVSGAWRNGVFLRPARWPLFGRRWVLPTKLAHCGTSNCERAGDC
jgi:hypothetical protein